MDLSPNRIFEGFLAQVRVAVDTETSAWLREQRWPEDFDAATRHVLIGAGKALRPALVFAVSRALAQETTLARPRHRRLALAVELMHTYSLVHDDLPAMDNDFFRRGRPTLHVLRNDAFAVLTGDALLTASFQCVTEAFADEPEKIGCAVALLSRAAGAAGMIGGQWLDMCSESKKGLSQDFLETIHRKKTGALFAACAQLAALKTRSIGDFKRIEGDVAVWGEKLGLLFQMVDDQLDAVSTRAQLGKTPGKDAEKSKLTYLSFMGPRELSMAIQTLASSLSSPSFAPGDQGLASFIAFVAGRDT